MAVPEAPAELSAREREVLDAVGDRLTNAEIAARLFISVRTVESHVAALLRKTGSASRRDLVALAHRTAPPPPPLPAALTSFIGRTAEREALAAALREHRLVTALGPGGVGKTRLALALAADLQPEWAGGSWVVDLVPVTDAPRLADAVAAALGVPEQPGRPILDSIADRLRERPTLLVLDNCEHLLDAVAALVERLLTAVPGLTVLATSRTRLAVPFEWVYPVPGLSVDTGGDAVELFRARALAAGADPALLVAPRIAAICRSLDGLALAIELAAARVPALGLDGVEAGLGHRLELLAGGRRSTDRHRSMRAALDWSVALLGPLKLAVFRRVSVFAAPFPVAAAVALLDGWEPASPARVPAVLADLADSSLLAALPGPGGTRLRCLDTVRQYGAELLEAAGEGPEARLRHLRWCASRLDRVDAGRIAGDDLRATLDEVAVELWAATADPWPEPEHRSAAERLARRFGELAFAAGEAREAQLAFERAATLADADGAVVELLDAAAGAAEARHFGDDSLALRAKAVDAALRAGLPAVAAWQLARQAETLLRTPGIVASPPLDGTAAELLHRARELAGGEARATIRIRLAELYLKEELDGVSEADARGLAEEAAQAHDPFAESAALDALSAVLLARNDTRGSLACATRRLELLDGRTTASGGVELSDALLMAVESALGAGELAEAAALAERWRAVHVREPHLAASRPMLVAALAGDLRAAVAEGRRFLAGWERAGRPRASNLAICAAAGAAAAALIGDDVAADRLRDAVVALASHRHGGGLLRSRAFEVLPLLHRGDVAAALERTSVQPEARPTWFNGLWRSWYAAAWAEAGVLAGEDPGERLARARPLTAQNPVAALLVERSAALAGDRGALAGLADGLEAAGARYQAARTRVMAGGPVGRRGERELQDLGAVPMTWPVGSVG